VAVVPAAGTVVVVAAATVVVCTVLVWAVVDEPVPVNNVVTVDVVVETMPAGATAAPNMKRTSPTAPAIGFRDGTRADYVRSPR
jgi:hypothetical protein